MSFYQLPANEQQLKIMAAFYVGLMGNLHIANQPEGTKDVYEEIMQAQGKDMPPFGWDVREPPHNNKWEVIIPGPQKDRGNARISELRKKLALSKKGKMKASASERSDPRHNPEIPNANVVQYDMGINICPHCKQVRKILFTHLLPRKE